MNNTDNKDFLSRVLNINLNDYLRDLGFNRLDLKDDAHAYHMKSYHDILIVDQKHTDKWFSYRSRSGTGYKNIVDFGTDFYKCTPQEFLDRIKDSPNLPPAPDQASYLMERREPITILTERQPILSRDALDSMATLQLSEAFIRKHCEEFRLKIGEDPAELTGIVLKNQRDYNHILVIKEDPDFEENVRMLHVKESFGHYSHLFIDRATPNVDVFASMGDVLVKQFQYERLGLKAPSLVLLSGISAFDAARKEMESHQQINLYLPNSRSTDLYKDYAQWLSPKYRDFSKAYVNDLTLANAHGRQERNGQLHRKGPGKSL